MHSNWHSKLCIYLTVTVGVLSRFILQALARDGKFSDAASIYYNGKNNVRNTGLKRTMGSFSVRNLTDDGPQSWAAKHYKSFNSMEYLKTLIE
jgi:hypothetical protein